MTEAIAVEIPDAPEEAERRGNTKTKIATAVSLGGLGVFAYFAQKNGWIHGDWPPPMRSFKHPWIGYYSAWMADKIFKRGKTSAAVVAGQIANAGAKTAQGAVNHPDGGTLYWLHNQHGNEANLDNFSDFALALGGTALYLAQSRGLPGMVKHNFSRLPGRFPGRPGRLPAEDLGV